MFPKFLAMVLSLLFAIGVWLRGHWVDLIMTVGCHIIAIALGHVLFPA